MRVRVPSNNYTATTCNHRVVASFLETMLKPDNPYPEMTSGLLPTLVYKLCRGCGLRFVVTISSRATYCSPHCRGVARSTKVESMYKQGQYLSRSGRKELYDSSLEHRHMEALDAMGLQWTKAHGITVSYFDPKKGRQRTYIPDFLVVLADGTRVLQETKPATFLTDVTVVAKANAARLWCARQGMRFEFATFAGQLGGVS